MLKRTLQNILHKRGKTYEIDSNIPDGLIFHTFQTRLFMLLRGLLFLRKKVFLGADVKIRNKSNFIFGSNVTIEAHTILDGYASRKISLGDNAKIGMYSKLLSTSHLATYGVGMSMGNNSAVGDFCHFGAPGGIIIGNDVIMGSFVSFHSENHNFQDTSKLIREQGVNSKGIILGNNIWVGARVTFLDGCEVGDNCVVAAGAVVNGIFPANSVIGGVPAKVLKAIV